MQITIRGYESRDLPLMVAIWNEVVEDGIAFPQEELLTEESGREFFAGQSWCGVAEDEAGKVLGLYILHPNNVGRCGHICNASYAVSKKARGLHIGEKLVLDCLKEGKKHGFGVLQFNAVVATNLHARHLYERLGFQPFSVSSNENSPCFAEPAEGFAALADKEEKAPISCTALFKYDRNILIDGLFFPFFME